MINKIIRSNLKNKRLEMSNKERDNGSYNIQKRLFLWINEIAEKALKIGNIVQIATFWPMPLEPNIIWLNNKLSELENISLSLPVTNNYDKYLEFKEWDRNTLLTEGKYGILEPKSKCIITRPDIILVPTLGYSNIGDRIGYGSGYYDRTLSKLLNKRYRFITIGIAWENGLIEEPYKAATHDIRLDAIITPKGWIKKPPEYY